MYTQKAKIISFTKPCDMLLKNWKLYLNTDLLGENEIERKTKRQQDKETDRKKEKNRRDVG
jgi:hypothetical protein